MSLAAWTINDMKYRILFAALAACLARPALALEPAPDEQTKLKACEKDLCTMILTRDPKGPDLSCAVAKTWASDDLKGGKKSGVTWMFGDVRCETAIRLPRADIVKAITAPAHTIKLKEQAVSCVVERNGETKPVSIKLAPKIKFKNGRADKIWINLGDMTGPDDVTGTVWTAASLEDTLGIFHKPMLKGVDRFIQKQCPKTYGNMIKPVVAKPTDTKPAAPKPAATAKPADPNPADAKPADAKPAPPNTAETKPEPSKPADAKAATPLAKPDTPAPATPAPSAHSPPAAAPKN